MARGAGMLLGRLEGLSDPVRLRLLRLLERQELGVAELVDVLQLPQSTVSRHLKLLSERGWLTSRPQGTTNLYRMRLDEMTPEARRLWQVAREDLEGWATLQQDQVRLERRLRERREGAQAFFAGAASRWDRLRDELYGRSFSHLALHALLPSSWVVADLACGTGSVAAEIAPWVAQVIGIDQSASMLKSAGKRLGGFTNVELRQGALESLPVEDGRCDAALLFLALTYVAEPEAVLREMARIVKPGGRVVIVDLLRHDRADFRREMKQQSMGFLPEELQRQLEQAGLTAAVCRPLPPESEARGPALLLAAATAAADHRSRLRNGNDGAKATGSKGGPGGEEDARMQSRPQLPPQGGRDWELPLLSEPRQPAARNLDPLAGASGGSRRWDPADPSQSRKQGEK